MPSYTKSSLKSSRQRRFSYKRFVICNSYEEVPFLHISHLVANKKIVNRPKDQVDVIYLQQVKKLLDETPES
jgi:hypothetical protein